MDILKNYKHKIKGILNGVDYDIWSPMKDSLIKESFNVDDIDKKRANKREIFKLAEFPSKKIKQPLAIIIGRLVPQKGWELILPAIPYLMNQGLYLAILGEGMPEITQELKDLSNQYRNQIFFVNRFDERLAHLFEAGADILLMPSKYEPCGLNQMYSMIYGTVPVVRETGGLKDTVIDVDASDEGAGFAFKSMEIDAFLGAVFRAVSKYGKDGLDEDWREIIIRGMKKDFSWKKVASEYIAEYKNILESK